MAAFGCTVISNRSRLPPVSSLPWRNRSSSPENAIRSTMAPAPCRTPHRTMPPAPVPDLSIAIDRLTARPRSARAPVPWRHLVPHPPFWLAMANARLPPLWHIFLDRAILASSANFPGLCHDDCRSLHSRAEQVRPEHAAGQGLLLDERAAARP